MRLTPVRELFPCRDTCLFPSPNIGPRKNQSSIPPKSNTGKSMKLLGLFTEHGCGVTYRSIGDPKAATPASFTPEWTRHKQSSLLPLSLYTLNTLATPQTTKPHAIRTNLPKASRREWLRWGEVPTILPIPLWGGKVTRPGLVGHGCSDEDEEGCCAGRITLYHTGLGETGREGGKKGRRAM